MSKKRVLVQSRFCHHNVRNCKSQSFESSQMISITIDDVPLDRRAKLEKGFGKWWADEENEKILNIFDKMLCEFCGIEVRTFTYNWNVGRSDEILTLIIISVMRLNFRSSRDILLENKMMISLPNIVSNPRNVYLH